ncbi:MAG: PAS domain S-box protein, partial [Chloroflexi bacterium]|nr:PAS domain S-box protein [Chloroflexota bacterium]
MTLRRKTLLVIALALTGLTLVLYATASAVLLNSFADLEADTAGQDVERVANAIAESIAGLGVEANDYAGWDDSYNYMVELNQDYIDDNYYAENFIGLGINIVVLYQPSGDVTFGRAFDLASETEVALPAGLEGLLANNPALLQQGLGEGTAGIVLLEEGPLMAGIRPILNSLRDQPSRGVLLMGRYLDEQEEERLAELTDLDVSFYRPDQLEGNTPQQEAFVSLEAGAASLIEPLSAAEIAGYTLLKDVNGEPALLLQVTVPRSIYQQGLASIRYLIFSLVAVGLVAGAVTLVLIERLVLARLARLNQGVGHIAAQGDLSERVNSTGRDELSSLAGQINTMLATLEQSQNSLRESEARYRAVVEQAAEGILLVDAASKRILEANEAYQEILGYTAEEIIRLTIYEVSAEEQASVDDDLRRMGQKQSYAAGERRHRRKDGTVASVELSGNLIASEGREVLCLVAHDVTARIRAEKELQRLLRETLLLNRIIATASSALHPDDVMRTVCAELAHAFHLPQAAFALLEPDETRLKVVAEYCDEGRPSALGVVIPVADNPATQYVLEQRAPLYLADVQSDPRYTPMRDVARQR